jgi:zinc transport system ATP-binding protein
MEAVIKVEHLWAGYEDEIVLEDINLTVQEGDFIGLIGPNGGGKTTLMRVLLGDVQPVRGTVAILGETPAKGRQRIGYVPQLIEFDRAFPISVFDVAQMGRLSYRKPLRKFTREDEDITMASLESVGLADLRSRSIGDLSGGQRQRVLIARALATEPRIMLLDEPTSSIDPEVSSNIYELLQKLNEKLTILLISHDMNAITSYVKTIGCVSRKLFYHGEKAVTAEMLEAAYECPIDLIAHGLPHRHLHEHQPEEVNV